MFLPSLSVPFQAYMEEHFSKFIKILFWETKCWRIPLFSPFDQGRNVADCLLRPLLRFLRFRVRKRLERKTPFSKLNFFWGGGLPRKREEEDVTRGVTKRERVHTWRFCGHGRERGERVSKREEKKSGHYFFPQSPICGERGDNL